MTKITPMNIKKSLTGIAYEKGKADERARWKKKIEDNKEAIHPSIYRELLGDEK